MSAVALLCILLALAAAVLVWLYVAQRRELNDVSQVSQQLQRIAIGGSLAGRVESASVEAGAVGADHGDQPSADPRRRRARRRPGDAEALRRARRAHPRGGAGPSRRDSVFQPAVRRAGRRGSRRSRRAPAGRPRGARVCRAGAREHPPAAVRGAGGGAVRGRGPRPRGPGEPARDHLLARRL